MQDFRTTKDFRKIKLFDTMHEDPTYLSFFFMFDYYSDHSPLLNGMAEDYLRNVCEDIERADSLKNFVKILKKVNSQYPWFWQSVSGLEKTRQWNMKDPFWGEQEIEIECLETVELTVSGMMDLYRKAAFDFNRWVEVIPKNLRTFGLHIYVSEVRTFSTNGKALKSASTVFNAVSPGSTTLDVLGNAGGVKAERPHFAIDLGHCEFDMNSTSEIFEGLNRSPEAAAAPKIKIKWEKSSGKGEYANSMLNDQNRTIGQMIGDIALEKAGEIVDSAIDRTVENIKGRLLLGNVYGANTLSTIQDAISAGSVNGIANLVGGGGAGDRPTTVPKGELGAAYDPVPKDAEGPIKENIHDRRPQDSEGPIGANVYDPSPQDSEGPLNDNVYK
jgi:hypothetical protein